MPTLIPPPLISPPLPIISPGDKPSGIPIFKGSTPRHDDSSSIHNNFSNHHNHNDNNDNDDNDNDNYHDSIGRQSHQSMMKSPYKNNSSPHDSPVKNSPVKSSPVKNSPVKSSPVKSSPVKNVVFSRPSHGEEDDDDDMDYEDYDLYGAANDDDDDGLGELQYVNDPIHGLGVGKGGTNQNINTNTKGGINASTKTKLGNHLTTALSQGKKDGDKVVVDVQKVTSSSTYQKESKNGWGGNGGGDDDGMGGGEQGSVDDQDSLDDVYVQSSSSQSRSQQPHQQPSHQQPSSSQPQSSNQLQSSNQVSPSKGKGSSSIRAPLHSQHVLPTSSRTHSQHPYPPPHRQDNDEEEGFSDLSGDERARLTPGQQQQRRVSNHRKNNNNGNGTNQMATNQMTTNQQQPPASSIQKSKFRETNGLGETGGTGSSNGNGGEGSGKVIAKHSVGFDRRAAGQGVGPGAGGQGQQQQKRQEAVPVSAHVPKPPLLPSEIAEQEMLKKKKKKIEPWRALKPLSVRAFVEVPLADVDDKYA